MLQESDLYRSVCKLIVYVKATTSEADKLHAETSSGNYEVRTENTRS
jgi:hypothetical protein